MRIELLDTECLPYKKHHYDAGFDLRSANEDILLKYTSEELIHTGIKVEIPEGHVGLVFPRSSFGRRGMVIMNTVGVIDAHYRGEIMVHVKNMGQNRIAINQYERFAQLVVVPVFLPELEIVDRVGDTERGEGGFGSTGS